jgi:cell division transport system ATP-binding protein
MSLLIQYKDVEICQDEQIVLQNIDLEVSSGEMIYLLGRVGSGKSSLMKTLYAELEVTGTTAEVLGYDMLKIKRKDIPFLRRKVGVVFQDFQLLTDRNV